MSNRHILLIVLSVLILAAVYRYDVLLFKRPQSVHNWRQSDCASLVMNYHQQDLSPWEPHIHAIISNRGTSSLNAPSELPLYYWSVARLYDIFGPREFLFRGVNTMIFLLGIAAFIQSLYLLSRNIWWSIFLGLILFTSPVLVYYGNNFITNAPAFGLALMALNTFIRFLIRGKTKYWYWTLFFFFLAGSLKITALFLFFAIGGVLLLQLFLRRSYPLKLSFFHWCLSALLILSPILIWIWHADFLNFLHETTYFSTTTFPVWDYSAEEAKEMIKTMYQNWNRDVFHPTTLISFGILVLYLIINFKRIRPFFRLLIPIFLLGIGIYFLLQFYTFVDHDYYTINMYMLFALLLLVLTDNLSHFRPGLINSPLAVGFLLLFLTGNMMYARYRLNERYVSYQNSYYQDNEVLYEDIEEWLTHQGVFPDDTVIYLPDASHTSLYLMNRSGWTSHKMRFKEADTAMEFNRTAIQLQKSVSRGAEYLIINGARNIYELEYTHAYQKHLHARKGELFVFDLKDTTRNFHRPERKLIQEIKLDMNQADSLFQIFDAQLTNYKDRNKVFVMTAKEEYALDIKLDSVEEGQMVVAEVWVKKGTGVKALPVIQSNEPGIAFVMEHRVPEVKDGWELMRQELQINKEISMQGVKVFLWKPEGDTAYFDDLRVKVYGVNPLLISGSE